MLATLENNKLKIKVESFGAQLKNLILKKNKKDYLWDGDPKYWQRRAPVLFPIVGRLKDESYLYQGKKYQMSQHGFARDKEFELAEKGKDFLAYILESDQETLAVYPFKFKLKIYYQLENNNLKISYEITNQDSKKIYFSIGAHPAFKWPFAAGDKKKDYYLEFEQKEKTANHLLDSGLLNHKKELLLDNQQRLELYPEIFENDALVFKNLTSDKISLKSKNSKHKIELSFADFPYLGIWSQSAKAPFICIEPWQGIADSIDSSGRLEEKEAIISLKKGAQKSFSYQIKLS